MVSECKSLVGQDVERRVCLDYSTTSQLVRPPLDWTLGGFVRFFSTCEREKETLGMKRNV